MEEKVAQLEKRISDLEARFLKNSHNSHKPPSQDGFQKPLRTKSLRSRSSKKPGGQHGHVGSSLQWAEDPDSVELHRVTECENCRRNLERVHSREIEKRQILEIPPIEVTVIEHHSEKKVCPTCNHLNQASFPEHVKGRIGYGPRYKALAVYFLNYQLIPYKRTCEIFGDLFGQAPSQGALEHFLTECNHNLSRTDQVIRTKLICAKIVHFDETAIKVNGKYFWIHAASNDWLTYYAVHPRRGKIAMDEIGILPEYKGIAIHDGLRAYFTYKQCAHVLCHAHHLRELQFIHEFEKLSWAKTMQTFLLQMRKHARYRKSSNERIQHWELRHLKKKYLEILELAKATYETAPQKGQFRHGKNLVNRLEKYRDCALAFLEDFDIPFTNNRVEQDLRMNKVKQKISGCFRTLKGAQTFCRIRSFLSTKKKRNSPILPALESVFQVSSPTTKLI